MRFPALLLLQVMGFHRPVHAQREYSQLTAGPFSYRWSNEGSVAPGDTLLVREVLLNPTASRKARYGPSSGAQLTRRTPIICRCSCRSRLLERQPGTFPI